MTAILKSALIVSLVGLAVGIVAHLFTAFGHPAPGFLLHALIAGAILLGCISTAIGIKIQADEADWVTTGWETLYQGIPIWVRLICLAAIVNVFFAGLITHEPTATAIVICFYALFGAVLYSAYRQPCLLSPLSCPNNHPVKHFNRFCPICGTLLPRIKGRA